MKRSQLHWYSLLTGFCALLLVATGAAVTSSRSQAKPVPSTIAFFENVHMAGAVIVALLTIGLAIWISVAEKRAWLIRFGWITFAIGIADGWLGWLGRTKSGFYSTGIYTTGLDTVTTSGPWIGTLHACLAALLFVAFASTALATSRAWNREPELVQDYGWPSLRFLSSAAAFLVALQVAFGAAFRHNLTGVMAHLLGALVVALFIMIVGAFVSNQFPKHATLRPMAVALMVITGIQVFLGMTDFIMRMMSTLSTPFLAISVAHVTTGSLTFAASVLLAIEVRRDVQPRDTGARVSGSDQRAE